jgi:hypothetical protein
LGKADPKEKALPAEPAVVEAVPEKVLEYCRGAASGFFFASDQEVQSGIPDPEVWLEAQATCIEGAEPSVISESLPVAFCQGLVRGMAVVIEASRGPVDPGGLQAAQSACMVREDYNAPNFRNDEFSYEEGDLRPKAEDSAPVP